MSDISDFVDSQKILYELKGTRRRTPIPPDGFKEARQLNDVEFNKLNEIPFIRLLGGKEPLSNVSFRYELYKRNWNRQMNAINAVLLKTNRFKFRTLRTFLNEKNQLQDLLTTALLNLGSNISNHDRLLNNLCKYLREDGKICLVKINPNICFNIQKVIKRIEDSIAFKLYDLNNNTKKTSNKNNKRRKYRMNRMKSKRKLINADKSTTKLELEQFDDIEAIEKYEESEEGEEETEEELEEELEKEEEEEEEEENEKDELINLDLNNEFDLLPSKLEKDSKYIDTEDMLQTFKSNDIKLVVLIQNADAMNSILIEQTLELLHKYNNISKVCCVIGISTPFIIFQEKIPKLLIGKLKSKTFSIDNSNEAINQIMEDLLLNINETYNSLIFDPKLVLKFLYRRNVMSIQQFNNYMKMIYMRHYFSQPLSLFWTNDFSKINLKSIYFEIFRTLPSVIENSDEIGEEYLNGIINNDVSKIGNLLRENLNKLINWRYEFRNLIDFLNFLQASISDGKKIWNNNLELFQLLFEKYYELRDLEDNWNYENDNNDNNLEFDKSPKKKNNRHKRKNQFLKSKISSDILLQFLDPLFDKLLNLKQENLKLFYIYLKTDQQYNFINKLTKFPNTCPTIKSTITNLIKIIKIALRDQICDLDLDYQAFREICVVRDDTILKIHDGFEPSIRENCLKNLDDPSKLLFNSKHWKINNDNNNNNEIKDEKEEIKKLDYKMFHFIEPILCEMYRIFKETGVNVNVYDFYQVFKNNFLRRKEIISVMKLKLEKNENEIKEDDIKKLKDILIKVENGLNNNDEKEWDKLTLSWFLKSLSEFEILGLLRESNNKSQSIEKVIWRGI
jgi:hypothetical protein